MNKYECPYCGKLYDDNESGGCCGESCAHWIEVKFCPECGEYHPVEDFEPHPQDDKQTIDICIGCAYTITAHFQGQNEQFYEEARI